MLVDWFIVVAQIINFLILVALLRWFLYRPVLSVMAKRKQGIEQQWNQARTLQEQAEAELAEYRQRHAELEAGKQAWLEEARREVEGERRLALEQLRHDIEEQRQRWRADLARDQEGALERLRAQLLGQVQEVARRALADLASADLEEQMLERFLERLGQLEPVVRQRLLGALAQDGGRAVVRTGFSLGEERSEQLRQRLAAGLPALDARALAFERQPQLLCGIELRTSSEVVGWSLDGYLAGLEQSVSEALASRSPAGRLGERLVRSGG